MIYSRIMRQEDKRTIFSQDELTQYFVSPRLYQKTGEVEARIAKTGEMIATVIDGEIETINYALDGNVVVKNPSGEEYILTRGKFDSRYRGPEPDDEYQTYEATGTTYAVEWTHGPGEFKASWGEMMIINDGDYLCSVTKAPDGDLYRIEAEAFATTYREIKDGL